MKSSWVALSNNLEHVLSDLMDRSFFIKRAVWPYRKRKHTRCSYCDKSAYFIQTYKTDSNAVFSSSGERALTRSCSMNLSSDRFSPSSSSSVRFTVSPDRVLDFFPSSPNTIWSTQWFDDFEGYSFPICSTHYHYFFVILKSSFFRNNIYHSILIKRFSSLNNFDIQKSRRWPISMPTGFPVENRWKNCVIYGSPLSGGLRQCFYKLTGHITRISFNDQCV